MRNFSKVLSGVALVAAAACNNRANVQCETDPNCNLTTGGTCAVAETGNHWCAYPDPSCPSGFRFSDQDVGDGVGGACVLPNVDAGIDAPVDGAPGGPAVSCKAIPHTCGASGTDDCCNSLTVTGGTFFRNFDAAADGDSGTKNSPAKVSTFKLDKYEVTVGRFRAFLDANRGTQINPPDTASGENPFVPGSGWQADFNTRLTADKATLVSALKSCGGTPFPTWTDSPGPGENLPITCITWYEAMAFCAWDGGFLPTDAEWNYAAAGGSEQRVLPFSNPAGSLATADSTHVNFGCKGAASCTPSNILPVGSLPLGDGKFGQSDLAGNASEWVLDWNEFDAGACLNGKNSTTDCADIEAMGPDADKLVKGGEFLDRDVLDLRTSHRAFSATVDRVGYTGFRCARAP